MVEYFYEMPAIERIIWITLPLLANVLLYLFINARTLKIFDKTNSKSLSLNSLRRMNTYVAVPLCILTTILYFLMIFYYLVHFNHIEFIANFNTVISVLIACALGLLTLFIKNMAISFTATKVAPIKNVKFYFNLNNISTYVLFYVLIVLMLAGDTAIFLLKPKNDLIHMIYTVIFYGLLFLITILAAKKIAKKQNPSLEMKDCELKKELYEMAARVKRKKVSIVVVEQDKSTFGAAAVYPVRHGTIFLSDTLLNTLTDEEVKAIMAHELGHLKYNHAGKRALTLVLGIILSFVLYNWLLENRYWYEPETLYCLVTLFGFFYYGIFSKYLLRIQEYRADAYVLKMDIPYEAFKNGMLKITQSYEINFDRHPLEEVFTTHPSLNNRFKRLLKLSSK